MSKHRAKRISAARAWRKRLNSDYQSAKTTLTGVAVGPSKIMIRGRLYDASLGDTAAGTVVSVENVGKGGRALYTLTTGSGSTIVRGGGSGGSSGGGGTYTGDEFLRRDGVLPMQANLNMGNYDIGNVGLVDGVDVSALGITVNALKGRTVLGGLGLQSDGVLLGVGSPSLSVKTGHGLEIGSDLVRVDQDADFTWTGEHRFDNKIGSTAFASGWAGAGWRLDPEAETGAHLELDSLFVRGGFTANELILNKIRATNGDLFVTDGGKVSGVTGSAPYIITAEDEHGFAVGDLIRAQRFTGSGIYQSNMQVTAVDSTTQYRATLASGDAPQVGYEYVRIGNVSDATRQGALFLSSSGTYAPYMDVTDGVDSWAAWASAEKLKVRIGQLDGITDPYLGSLEDYGAYIGRLYARGTIVAGNGNFAAGDDGVMIQAGLSSTVDWDERSDKLTFSTDPLNPSRANTVAQQYAERYSGGGVVTNAQFSEVRAGSSFGGTTNAVQSIEVQHWSSDVAVDNNALITMMASETDASIAFSTHLLAGRFLFYGTSLFRNIHMMQDVAFDIGEPSKRVRDLYVKNLHVGTSYTTDTGHEHDNRYYTETEIDGILAGYSQTGHTHDGYATSSALSSHMDDAHVHRSINDAGTGATDLWSASKINAAITEAIGSSSSELEFNSHVNSTAIHTPLDDAATSNNRLWSAAKIISTLGTLETSLRNDLSSTAYIDNLMATHLNNAAAHHAPVTVGANLTLSGQAISLGSNVALANVDNHFSTSQSITGGLSVTTDVIGNRYGKFGDGLIIGSTSDTPDAPLDVRGNARMRDISAEDIVAHSVTAVNMVMEHRSTVVSGGEQLWTPRGSTALYEALALTSGQSTINVPVKDPAQGHYTQFLPGDQILISGSQTLIVDVVDGGNAQVRAFLPATMRRSLNPTPMMASKLALVITDYPVDNGTHFTYPCEPLFPVSHPVQTGTFAAGTAVAGFGAPSADHPVGTIRVSANRGDLSPQIKISTINGWTSTIVNPIDHVLIGNLTEYSESAEGNTVGILIGDDLKFPSRNRVSMGNNGFYLNFFDGGGNALEINPDVGINFFAGLESNRHLSFIAVDGIEIGWMGVHGEAGNYDSNEYKTALIGEWIPEGKQGYFYGLDGYDYTDPDNPIPVYGWGMRDMNNGGHSRVGANFEDGSIGAYLDIDTDEQGSSVLLRAIRGAEFGNISLLADDYITIQSGADINIRSKSGTTGLSGKIVEIEPSDIFLLRNVPTSDVGLPIDAVWSDGGTLKLVN